MNSIKTPILNILANIIRILTAFISNKFLSVYLGPSGIAMAGQFQNFIGIVTTFSNGGVTPGIIKYIAEYDSKEQKKKVISSSLFITMVFSTIISLFTIIFNNYLSVYLLKNAEFYYIFNILAFTLVFFSFNSLIIAVFNGYKEIRKVVYINIISSLFGLFYSIFLVYFFKLSGLLIAYSTSQSIVFLFAVAFVFGSGKFNIRELFKGYDKDIAFKLLKYSLMTLVSALCVNLTQIYIRLYITSNLSLNEAGYWQSMIKLSDLYLSFITSTLSVYYLPRLSECKNDLDLRDTIIKFCKLILPLLFLGNILIYLMRYFIISLLFSKSFLPMADLFAFQMIGDFFKISSWILSFVMVAKAMTKGFIYTEIIFSLFYISQLVIFVNLFGFIGISYAWASEYFFYLLTMIWMFKHLIFIKKPSIS